MNLKLLIKGIKSIKSFNILHAKVNRKSNKRYGDTLPTDLRIYNLTKVKENPVKMHLNSNVTRMKQRKPTGLFIKCFCNRWVVNYSECFMNLRSYLLDYVDSYYKANPEYFESNKSVHYCIHPGCILLVITNLDDNLCINCQPQLL